MNVAKFQMMNVRRWLMK